MSENSEDPFSSLSSSDEVQISEESNNAFDQVVPPKSDVSIYFEKVDETFSYCKHCKEAHERGDLTLLMKIKTKQENMRKHLKSCKFFCSANNIGNVVKQTRPKTSVAKPEVKAVEEGESVVVPAEAHVGCKLIQVKWMRRTETLDVTPSTTGSMIVNDLKVIFGIDDGSKCYLKRESVC